MTFISFDAMVRAPEHKIRYLIKGHISLWYQIKNGISEYKIVTLIIQFELGVCDAIIVTPFGRSKTF